MLCIFRNPNVEQPYLMEADLVYLTNHSVPEACLSVLTEFELGEGLQLSMP
jgi:hypothetical protein